MRKSSWSLGGIMAFHVWPSSASDAWERRPLTRTFNHANARVNGLANAPKTG